MNELLQSFVKFRPLRRERRRTHSKPLASRRGDFSFLEIDNEDALFSEFSRDRRRTSRIVSISRYATFSYDFLV